MTEKIAQLLIQKLSFLCFSGVATASNLFLSTSNSLPTCWYCIPAFLVSFPLFLYLGGKILLALQSLLLSFQEHSLHDYEENEPLHSYFILIFVGI